MMIWVHQLLSLLFINVYLHRMFQRQISQGMREREKENINLNTCNRFENKYYKISLLNKFELLVQEKNTKQTQKFIYIQTSIEVYLLNYNQFRFALDETRQKQRRWFFSPLRAPPSHFSSRFNANLICS